MVKIFKALTTSLLIATLAACGGGGGSAGTPVQGGGGATGGGKLSLSLVDATGAASNILSGTGLTAKAAATDANGSPVKNVVVTFTVDSAIATLSPVSGTALTDSNGIAQISLKPGVGTGAGTLTASATVAGTAAVTTTATYSVTAGTVTPSAINFTSAVPADKSIVLKGAGGNGRTEAALLTFVVVDSANVGIPNLKVNFSLPSTNLVTLGAASGITDATGKVTVTVNSGTTPTTVRVVATVDGTSVSTLSDTVTVTTGQPTQAALTVARQKVNIEGINFAGETNQISVFMADQFGGVVANGTQVVFTTNAGAIIGDGDLGGKDTARCLTTNGTCFVTWRSQNPIASVVTVVVTSATATETLTGSSSFTNSGSHAFATFDVVPVLFGVPQLDFTSSCSPQLLTFTLTDQNGYVLPDASKLTLENLSSATITVYPDAVVAPTTVGAGGTSHTLTITPPGTCKVGGVTTVIKPVLVLTTPKGVRSTFQLNITFPTP